MAEIWVYLSFAIGTVWIRNWKFYHSFLVVMTLISSATLGILYSDLNVVHGYAPLARAIAGFYVGALCYQAIIKGANRATILLISCFQTGLAVAFGNFDLLAIPISALVVFGVVGVNQPQSSAARKALGWLGDISYPVYLWHFLISVIFAKVLVVWFGDEKISFNNETFVIVSPVIGNLACLVLLIVSLTVAQVSIILERQFWKLAQNS